MTARRTQRSAGRAQREMGFTLVELMIYSILMIVVLTIAGVLFIRMLNTQRDTIAMANANNEAQVTFKQMEFDIRNADFVQVAAGGDLMVMKTRSASATDTMKSYCVGYYFDSAGKTLYRTQTTSSTPTVNALAAGSAAALKAIGTTWTVRSTDVAKVGTTRVFGSIDGLFESPDGIALSLRSNTSDKRKPVDFAKTVSIRPQSGIGGGCR